VHTRWAKILSCSVASGPVDGQTGSYEPGAAHVTHLTQSDSKERKVKSSRLHITCRSCQVIATVYAPEPRLI
jgi:hypothetical protein